VDQTSTASPNPTRRLLAAVIGSTVGTTIEWYDFFLYGTAAALVFRQAFFPEQTPLVGQILAFLTFSVGFISRPLGGVIFGRMGDRHGRKVALVATLLLMGVSTLLIGFLPTYHQVGSAAPLILVTLRFLQGVGVGGEWGGAVLLALETGHRGRRGFFASFPQVGVPLGLLLSTGAIALCERYLSKEEFVAWGWRIPFFASFLLIVVGFLIRSFVTESPLFAQVKTQAQTSRAPIREVVQNHWKEIVLGAGSRLSENAVFYLFALHILTYGKDVLHVPSSITLNSVNTAAALACFTIPLFGALSDVWSRKAIYFAGNFSLLALAIPYYAALGTRQPQCILLATLIMLGVVHAMLYAVQASLISENFPTRIRYSGASLAYQLAGIFAGAPAPIIATLLIEYFPGSYWPLAAYIIVLATISMASIHFLAETKHRDIAA
jgi:metabolite-proton symporter